MVALRSNDSRDTRPGYCRRFGQVLPSIIVDGTRWLASAVRREVPMLANADSDSENQVLSVQTIAWLAEEKRLSLKITGR